MEKIKEKKKVPKKKQMHHLLIKVPQLEIPVPHTLKTEMYRMIGTRPSENSNGSS